MRVGDIIGRGRWLVRERAGRRSRQARVRSLIDLLSAMTMAARTRFPTH